MHPLAPGSQLVSWADVMAWILLGVLHQVGSLFGVCCIPCGTADCANLSDCVICCCWHAYHVIDTIDQVGILSRVMSANSLPLHDLNIQCLLCRLQP